MLSRAGGLRNFFDIFTGDLQQINGSCVITVGYSYFNTVFRFIGFQIIEVSASEHSLKSLTGLKEHLWDA